MKNVIFLIGRLVNDPEIKESESERKHAVITVAVQRDFKNSDGIYETDFIRCNLWNGIATQVNEYCHKGDLIGIKGRIQNRSWDDQNGQKRYATDFIIENAYFADSRRDQTMTNEEVPSSSMDGEFITVDDTDDLPF